MLNRDFLKAIIEGKKRLLKATAVKRVSVHHFEELLVKNIFPRVKDEPEVMVFLPDKLPKGKLPDRQYFFNVLNTVRQEYVSELIAHANSQRFSTDRPDIEKETIAVHEDWWAELNSLPFVSCK